MGATKKRRTHPRLILGVVGAAAVLCLCLFALWPKGAQSRGSRSDERATGRAEQAGSTQTVPGTRRESPLADQDEEDGNRVAVIRFRDRLGAVIPSVEVRLPRSPSAATWTASTDPPIAHVRIPADVARGADSRHFEVRARGYRTGMVKLTDDAFMEGGQTVVLEGALSVCVRVLARDGAGIPQATVSCKSSDSDTSEYRAVGTKVTAGSGEVVFSGLPGQSSRLRFAVSCDGYRATTYSFRPRRGETDSRTIEIALVPSGDPVLRGVVRWLGKPVENAIVELIPGRIPLKTRTSAAGEFSFPEGPAGRVRFRVRPDSAASAPASWFVPKMAVVVLPRHDPLEVEVVAGRLVRVVVTDRAGKPQPRVGVWHWDARDSMPAPARTDESGIAFIGGVALGETAIGISHNGIVTRTVVPAGTDELRVIVASKRRLRGEVVDSRGRPVAGASVRSPGFVKRLKTDTRGRFVSEHTVPGGGIVLVELGDRAVKHEYRAEDTDLRIVLP